jgi:hypothetical protein
MITPETAKTLLTAIKQVKRAYAQRGFALRTILLNGQFEPIRVNLAGIGITMNGVARAEHVPEIERYIRTTKERTRCIYNMLPFKKVPARITIEMVYASIFWLNMPPPVDGVSKTHSPRNIICGHQLNYMTHCKLEFGTYVQVHEQHDKSLAARTTGATALRPTGNTQGGYYFYSLTTGRRLSRNHWTNLPMPAEVIERVHQLADQGNAPHGLSFANRTGINPHADDDEGNDDYYPDVEGDDDDTSLIAEDIAGVTGEINNENENDNEDENENEENFQNENENEKFQNENEDEENFPTNDEAAEQH